MNIEKIGNRCRVKHEIGFYLYGNSEKEVLHKIAILENMKKGRYKMKKAKETKKTSMIQYVGCSHEQLAQKLYEDLSIESKDEGFAQYCYYTAVEAMKGIYESFEEIQADLDGLMVQEY